MGYFTDTDHIYMTSSFPEEKDGKAKESFIKSIYTMIKDENQSRPVTGTEINQPMAIAVIGGLLTSTLARKLK